MTAKDVFPFSAVVGQEEAQLALLLAAVDPAIGGVLLRGDKGSAKSTLARGLAALLPADAPFVELPVGATEDRVLGSLDLRAALSDGADRFRPGLLAAAHGGVLYVDEVNLLPDHLVDGLLDAAASGVNRVERDGVSHEHPARFVLLGSMNPEEGELRPQLLDRFGLSVEVRTPLDPMLRAEAVRRRLAHDAGRPTATSTATATSAAAAARHEDELSRRRLPTPDALQRYAEELHRQQSASPPPPDHPAGTDDPQGQAPAPADSLTTDESDHRGPITEDAVGADDLQHRGPADEPATTTPDRGSGSGSGVHDEELRQRLAEARSADLPDEVIEFGARLAVEVGAESLRADLVLCRAAAALAGWEGRPVTTTDDITRVAPLALGHRRRRRPFDPPTLPPDELASAIQRASDSPDDDRDGDPPAPEQPSGDDPTRTERWQDLAGDALAQSPEPLSGLTPPPPRPTPSTGGQGRIVGDRRPSGNEPQGLAVLPTVRAALQRRASDPTGNLIEAEDLREPRRARRQGQTVVLVLDTSGSMGTAARVGAATGAVLGLLADAYLRRDQVALVAFRGTDATEVLPPTASVELARACLADLPTGGATPLADGLSLGLRVAQRAAGQGAAPLVVLLSDGRATGQPNGLDDARSVATAIADAGIDALVLDAEDGQDGAALGLAHELARVMDARYVHLSDLSVTAVETAVRQSLA